MGEVVTSRFTIDSQDAELAVQRVDKVVKLCNMTVAELKKNLSEMFVDQTGKMGQSNKKTAEGTEGIKAYRQEQRIQDYVIRQTTQSLTSMIFALGFLSQGQDKAGSTTHKVTTSLLTGVAAMEAVEFSMFGLGQAGEKMGGTMGKAMVGLSKWGGPIAMAVGALATLVAWISLADETAKKASEGGVERFIQGFTKLSKEGQAGTVDQMKSKIKELETERAALVSMQTTGYRSQFGPTSTTVYKDPVKYKQLGEDIKAMQELLTNAEKEAKQQAANLKKNKEADDALKGHYTTIQDINRALAIRNQEVQEGVDLVTREALTQGQIQQRVDEIERLTFQRTQLLKSSTQLAAEEQKRQEKRLETTKQIAEADQKLFADAQALELGNIQNTYARQRAEEEQKHTERLANIEEEAARANEIGIDASGKRIFTGDAARAADAERERNRQANLAIARTETEEISRLKLDAIQTEEQRIKAKFDLEKRLINESADTQELKTAKIAKLEREQANALHQNELQFLSDLGQGFQAIEQGLNSIGIKSESVLSRIVRAVQAVVAAMTLLEQMNKKEEGGSTGDWLGIIGNVLKFAGSLGGSAGGGWTGPGSRNEIAGFVHRDEVVFEKSITQRYRNQLLSLRNGLQRGIPISAAMPASDNGNLATSVLVSEIRSLKQAVRSIQIQQPIILAGTMEGQRFMRKELPDAQKFLAIKQRDKE